MEKESVRMTHEEIRIILEEAMPPDRIIGVVGVGKFGTEIVQCALESGMTVLRNDPPRAMEESEEERNEIYTQWGNGMGGCLTVKESPEAFLPLDYLLERTLLLSIQIPDTEKGFLNRDFLRKLNPDATVLIFSGRAIAEPGLDDPRLRWISPGKD